MEIERQIDASTATLTLRGRLDAAWSGTVTDALQKAVRDGFLDLRLELSAVSYISSAGLRILLSQWKELRRAQGRLSIINVSAEVERVLRMAGLAALLDAGEAAPQTRAPMAATSSKNFAGLGFTGEIEEIAPDTRWRGKLVGHVQAPFNLADIAKAPLETVKLPASALALGFGALGSGEANSGARLGELLAAGGCAVQLPAGGENQADYAVTLDALAPEAQMAHGLIAEGGFARHVRFEATTNAVSAPLSGLLGGLLAASDAPQIAFAMIAEASALVGACLRRAPSSPGAENIFAFPNVRDWLTFTAEPAYKNTVVMIVGVAAQPGASALGEFVRPSGTGNAPLLHAHAAAFPFRPIRHGHASLAETATSLFDGSRVLGVLHLLADHRPEVGAGESRFYRGACWFGPLDL